MSRPNKDGNVEEALKGVASRGRKAVQTAQLAQDAPLDGALLTQNQNLAAQHSLEVLTAFGDGQPYDRLRYLERARFHMARSAEEALAVGRCLIVIKESEPHGEWLGILEQLGIEQSLARRMAQAALKFSGVDAPTQLIEAAKSKSKLFELMVLDDDELQALSDGGTVAGLQLDDIDRMPVSQLRAALRDAREDKKAHGQMLAEKNARIDSLTTKLEKANRQVQAMSPDQRAQSLRQEVASIAFESEAGITGRLREGFNKLLEHTEEHGGDHRTFMASALHQLEAMIAALREEFHLPTQALEGRPEWMDSDPDTLPLNSAGA